MSRCRTPLTPDERAITQQRLQEAEQAYHSITLGGMARTFVDQNGERVEYAPANVLRLRGYILELRAALGLPLDGACGPLTAWMVP